MVQKIAGGWRVRGHGLRHPTTAKPSLPTQQEMGTLVESGKTKTATGGGEFRFSFAMPKI